MAIVIYEKGTKRRLFEITPPQRDQLIDALEEEDAEDHDYYVDAAVCDFLDDKVDAPVVATSVVLSSRTHSATPTSASSSRSRAFCATTT